MGKPPPFPFFILRGHEGNVTALLFNNETSDSVNVQPTLISGSETGEIFIWDLKKFRALFKLTCPEKKPIFFLRYYKTKLYTQSQDGILNIWAYQNNSWNVTKKVETTSIGFCSPAFWLSGDKAFMTLFNENKSSFSIYNIEEENKIKDVKISSSGGLIMCLKTIKIEEKQLFLIGSEDGTIKLIDSEENKLKSTKLHKDPVICFDFDSEFKRRGVSGSTDEFLQVWTISDSYSTEKVHQLTLPEPGISDVKIREDGKIFISAGWDFSIRIFSWKTLKPLAVLNFHEQSVQCLAYSLFTVDKKNSVFASGSKDKSIALWSIY